MDLRSSAPVLPRPRPDPPGRTSSSEIGGFSAHPPLRRPCSRDPPTPEAAGLRADVGSVAFRRHAGPFHPTRTEPIDEMSEGEMSEASASIEFVIRIGEAPPPVGALDRWPDATWSHHADPLDGLVELGRRLFASRADRAWAPTPEPRLAVLVTLREPPADEVAAAIATHLAEVELWMVSPGGDMVEVAADAVASRAGDVFGASPSPETSAEEQTPDRIEGGDARTVSSEEIRMLLGETIDDGDRRRHTDGERGEGDA